METESRGRAFAPASVVAALMLAASLLSSCTSMRNTLGPRESICFRVIPEARAAVGLKARFDGVRALSAKSLYAAAQHSSHYHVKVPPELEAAVKKSTCLVAFTGTFTPAGVEKAWTPRPGPYHVAIVVLLQSNSKVVATVLLKKIPLRFAHLFAFQR